MSHDTVNRCAKGRTIECGAPLAGAWHQSRGCRHGAIARVWPVAPPGLSLPRRGGGDRPSGPGHRTVDPDHVEDSGQRGARSAQLFGRQRTNTRRDCSACHLDLSQGNAQAWLRAREGIARSISTMRSIACSPTNFSMPTRSSFRTGYGSSRAQHRMEVVMKMAAIYARVASDKQKEEKTIASQTAALVAFASDHGYDVPGEWIFEDEGFSGASLVRPGLERLRDLAAEGQIEAVLVYAPDRLSRKYAYQVLLTEEFARGGVETVFLKAPHSGTPEDQLMLQFQGMIAEYERAQILERSRRGKRHRAKAGEVSVLGGAPYGYRYIRKTSEASARYETDAAEAEVVRLVYDKYTVGGRSIGAIARLLRGMGVPTRRRVRWERSVVWAILRNPAYKGTACFNKTQTGPRQKVTKPFRLSGRAVHGDKSSSHERPRDEWIEIPVPAIVSEETFALAAERLADNKRFAPRRTIEPSIVQGLVSCRKCG